MKHVPTLTAMVVQPGESTPRVSSRQIAEAFGKNHQHVLRKVKDLLTKCPANFGLSNFGQSNYLNSQGKTQAEYLLTRDAFSLLVMGFTGEKALFWKIRYIQAFNEMEQQLFSQRLLAAPEGQALIKEGLKLAKRLTPDRLKEMKKAVRYKEMGLCKTEIGRLLNCGPEKAGNLLRDYDLSRGGAQ